MKNSSKKNKLKKMNNKIKVSIICSAYNREKYLQQCVESILSQTLTDIELILIDNGSTDSTPDIVDEFAKKDTRVIPIHNPLGSTYGQALNQGISLAKGDYIGIVESDDFIHETMYEKLYNKITTFDADVSMCSFNRYLPFNKIVAETRIAQQGSDTNLYSIKDYPFLLCLNPSIWAKLYKSDFIKKLKFDENCKYCDTPFMVDLFFSTNRIISVKEYLYNYRQDNPDASTANNIFNKTISKIVDAHVLAKNKLICIHEYSNFKEEINYHAAYVFEGWYKRTNKKNKTFFLEKCRKYFLDLQHDKTFTFKYFSNSLKAFVINILQRNYSYVYATEYKQKSIGKLKLYEFIKLNNLLKIKILYCTIFKMILDSAECKISIASGLITSVKNYDKEKIIIKFLGIPVYILKNKKHREKSQEQREKSQEQQNDYLYKLVHTDIVKLTTAIVYRANAVYNLHNKVFPQFKGIYRGKKVVVIAAGPTLNDYSPLSTAVHIGVNKTFMQKKVDLDYLFILDYPNCKDVLDEANSYRRNQCKKFYGMPQEQNHPCFIPDSKCPEDVYRYFINNSWNDLQEQFNYDLSTQTLPCFFSVSFQAIAFALWTQPAELYLVGCDNDFSKHFDNSPLLSYDKKWVDMHKIRTMDGFRKLKNFSSIYYPDTKIISINPVGLKGIFHDVYTKSYLQKHSEIDIQKVTVLE